MYRSFGVAVAGVFLSGCSSAPLKGPVAQAAVAAKTVQSTEGAFLTNLRSRECTFDRLNSLALQGPSAIDVQSPCSTPGMTDANLKVRKEFLDALVLYAQALSSLESVGTSDFDTAMKSAASQFGTDAKGPGFLTAFSPANSAAGDAVAGLQTAMDWIIAQHRDEQIKEAASKNQKAIIDIVSALKQENTLEGNRATLVAISVAKPVHDLTSDPPRLAQVANALIVYQAYWGTGPAAIPMMSLQVPSPDEANASLDQLQACHTLVAAGGKKEDLPKGTMSCRLDFIPLKLS